MTTPASYARNKEHILAKSAEYREQHREQLRAQRRAYQPISRITALNKRRAAARAAQLERPRCIICQAPIRHGQPGVRRATRTCGNKPCTYKAYDWYVRRVR